MNTKHTLVMRHDKDGNVRPEAMAEHTPGPWYEYDMGWSGQTAIAVKHANSNFLIVPAMNKGANARLIAAAPELLEALTAAQQLLSNIWTPEVGKRNVWTSTHAAIDAAIAKATNETL